MLFHSTVSSLQRTYALKPQQFQRLPAMGVRMLQPTNQKPGFAEQGTTNVILVKTLVCTENLYAHNSHGIPPHSLCLSLPTPIHSSPPFSLHSSFSAVSTPDSRAISPQSPKHLIEQLGLLTCGLICSLNTWLIQKKGRNSGGSFFFFPTPPALSSSYSRLQTQRRAPASQPYCV